MLHGPKSGRMGGGAIRKHMTQRKQSAAFKENSRKINAFGGGDDSSHKMRGVNGTRGGTRYTPMVDVSQKSSTGA